MHDGGEGGGDDDGVSGVAAEELSRLALAAMTSMPFCTEELKVWMDCCTLVVLTCMDVRDETRGGEGTRCPA